MGGTHNSIIGVRKTRAEAADVDSWGPSSCSKDKDYDMRNLEPVYHNELGSHVEARTTHLSGSPANEATRDPTSYVTAEGFGCSNYEPQDITSQSLLYGSKLKNKEPPESIEARDCDQNLLCRARSSGAGNIAQIENRNINLGVFPSNSSLVSSNGSSIQVPPASFQFYVRSEEGINLCVDLNSSASDWIKSLKSEVCINRKVQNSNCRVLHRELRIFREIAEQMKASSIGNIGVDLQTNGDPNYIESSLSSIVRESDHFGVDHPDGTERLSRSSAIVPINNAVEISGLVMENDQRVSSLCKSNSDLQNLINLSSELCNETVTLGSEVPSISQTTSTGKFLVDSKSGGSKMFDSSENQSKSDSICPENAETVPMCTSVSSETDLPMFSKICKDLIPPDTAILENPSGVCHRCSTSDSMGMQLSEVASHCEDTLSSRQNRSQPVMDHRVNDLQTENGGSVNYVLERKTCSDPLYACAEEWGRSNPITERESSECSQINNFLRRTSRSSNSSDTEGLQSKRQHTNSEDHDSNATKLTRKVLPRRSSRLVSKLADSAYGGTLERWAQFRLCFLFLLVGARVYKRHGDPPGTKGRQTYGFHNGNLTQPRNNDTGNPNILSVATLVKLYPNLRLIVIPSQF
ncbi:hypothetical protein BVC80_1713g14 [Macleaya cordata]|uniref:Uncharacterized protein n=1 Tax=Macleaya cordata TaxID=56857 RepID=A0A200Q2D0_MACCD|nr:hypothetical protein BVC80_1713g14 [Macleaya cordata]